MYIAVALLHFGVAGLSADGLRGCLGIWGVFRMAVLRNGHHTF